MWQLGLDTYIEGVEDVVTADSLLVALVADVIGLGGDSVEKLEGQSDDEVFGARVDSSILWQLFLDQHSHRRYKITEH